MLMSNATLPRRQRRALKRAKAKEQPHGRTCVAAPVKTPAHGWLAPLVWCLLLVALASTALIASVRAPVASARLPAVSREQPLLPAPASDANALVQVFLGVAPVQPEIVPMARSTADWYLGKLNPEGTEMWVAPSQEFWVSNRQATLRAADLRPGDQLPQEDGSILACTGTIARPIVADEEFVAAYHRLHGEDASVPLGEPGMFLSKVTKTFQNETKELYQIYYGSAQPPADLTPLTLSRQELEDLSRQTSANEAGTVFVTGRHPYYVLNKAEFVPVETLEAGDRFRTSQGEELVFHGKRRISAKAGETFPVYNVEVADNHTYFAGKEGVWVHNLCDQAVEAYTSVFLQLRKTHSMDDALKEVLHIAVYDHKISSEEASVVARSLLLREGRSHLFDLFAEYLSKPLDLTTASAEDGRSYITYAFKNSNNQVTYVGRASGPGNPVKVLRDRIAKGHKYFNDSLTPVVIDVQKTVLANRGAEEFFLQAQREIGSPLENIDESLSFANTDRTIKSITKLDAFFEELFAR